MSGYRLAQGGGIDRARPLGFTWDGRAMQGLAGDTLASALMANGEHILARSFKYHRPRGIMSAGPEEGGALGTVGAGARGDPNPKATRGPLGQGGVIAQVSPGIAPVGGLVQAAVGATTDLVPWLA